MTGVRGSMHGYTGTCLVRRATSMVVVAALALSACGADDDATQDEPADTADAAAEPSSVDEPSDEVPASAPPGDAPGTTDATGDGGTVATTPLEPVDLTVQLQIPPSGSVAFLYWAVEQGWFEDAGINLTIVPGQSSQGTVEAVEQGQADIGFASGVAVVLGVANGQNLRSIGSVYSGSSFGLFTPGEGSSPEEMAESLVGGDVLTIAGGPQNPMFDRFMESFGLDPESVSKTNVPFSSLVQLYADGEGDGLTTALTVAEAVLPDTRPSSSVLFRDTIGIEPPDATIVVRNDFLEANADVLARFLQVTYDALEAQRTDPDAAVAALVAAEPTLTAEIAMPRLLAQQEYLCPLGGTRIGETLEQQWIGTIELFTDAGIIDGAETADVYTDRFFTGDAAVESAAC